MSCNCRPYNYGSRKTEPFAPSYIEASDNFVNQISITWLESEEINYFNLYRDGFLLSVMPNNVFEYIDSFVVNDSIYEYCLESVNDCGNSNWTCDTGSLSIGQIGDVNLDQVIDVLDVVRVLNFVLEQSIPSESEFWLADLNSDGFLNVLDIVLIVNIILS